MNTRYRAEELEIKRIIKSNINLKNTDDKLNVIIYYKSTKTRELVMKNNLAPKPRDLSKTNLVYEFQCQKDACKHLPPSETKYVGLTTCQLTRRLSYHLQNGAIILHSKEKHGQKTTRDEIVQWTKIRYFEHDVNRLEILESLIIRQEEPKLNRQDTGKLRVLKVYGNA